MSQPERSWQDEVGQHVLTLQIIVAALTLGCVIFLGIVSMVGSPRAAADASDLALISWTALGWAGCALVLRMIVPPIVVARGREKILRGVAQPAFPPQEQYQAFLERTGDAGRLFGLYMTRTIVAAAILEGATFFLLIAYLLERNVWAVAAAVAFIFLIASHLPTRHGVVHWVEDQLDLLEHERQLADSQNRH
jgi:hypothetical protein